ncbi:MAG: ABC transporter ATP-binding protein [Ruminococcaceae bacterium]|nr:ABC transporter ATP-binding protein [Oscillospiraceae bacterium]
MGPGFMGPPPRRNNDKYKEPLPKNIREVPSYLKRFFKGFFYRMAYILKLIWETRKWIIFAVTGTAVFNGAAPVVGAFINAHILNALAEAYGIASAEGAEAGMHMLEVIVLLFAAQVAYTVIQSAVGSLSHTLSRIYGELVTNHIKVSIMQKSKTLDVKSFDDPDFYERFENASREAGMRPIQVLESSLSIFSSFISIVSFVAVLWALSPYAPWIIIALAIPGAVVNFVYRKKMVKYMRERSKDRRQLAYYSELMTNKDMVKEVRILGLSDVFIERYESIFKKYFKGLKKIFLGEGIWHTALNTFTAIVNCGLLIYIAYNVCNGEMQIGNYSLYSGALSSISGGVGNIVTKTAAVYEGTLFIDNLIRFMNEKRTIVSSEKKARIPERHIEHIIRFENVSFRYPGTERNVIDNVSFELRSGDKAVLVGLNGAGKTTLIKLLTRLYDPTEGTIYFDGYDIKEYDPVELYKVFGIVFQDYGKYAVSVRDNISFGQVEKEIDDENIISAAHHSNADSFIKDLPAGYDTPLMRFFEENGIELSIGQWQKLAIARAFYSDSDILILDEPTASLDAIAEQEIFDQFDELRKGKLSIFVSHRLSSATTASKIFVLEHGKLIEQGTHSELMSRKDGKYRKLFTTQAKNYIEHSDKAGELYEDMPMKGRSPRP